MKKKTSIPYQTVNKFDQDCKTEEITKCIETGKSQEWLKLMWIKCEKLEKLRVYSLRSANRKSKLCVIRELSRFVERHLTTKCYSLFPDICFHVKIFRTFNITQCRKCRKISIHSFVDIRCPMNTLKGNVN